MNKVTFIFIKTLITISIVFLVSHSAFSKELTLTGCSNIKTGFLEKVAQKYEEKTQVKIILSGGGSTTGIRKVSEGTSDLGSSSRHSLTDVAGNVQNEEKNAKLVQIAWDAIVIAVHPNNPVKDITSDTLKKIYDGEIVNWSQLGGPDKRIILINQDSTVSGFEHMFRGLIFNNPDYEIKAKSLNVNSSDTLERKIETTETAIGVTSLSSSKKRTLKLLSFNGIQPTKEALINLSYSMCIPIYATTNIKTTPESQAFIDYLLSEDGQKIISEEGALNIKEGTALEPLLIKLSKC